MIAYALLIASLFCVVGCNKSPEYTTDEKGRQYLVLPISKKQVKVSDEHRAYLDDIDFNMLKEAEEKIADQVSQYKKHSDFYLQVDNGCLSLCTEVIVYIDPPEGMLSEDGEIALVGCDIDHKHLFFGERITK